MPLTSSELYYYAILDHKFPKANNQKYFTPQAAHAHIKQKGYDETTILNLGTLDSVELYLYIKQYCITGGKTTLQGTGKSPFLATSLGAPG